MPSADTPIHPEENPSTTASPRSSMIRVPRRLLWFSAAVLTWFLVSEGATEAWYRWKESQVAMSESWSIDWPKEESASLRGLFGFRSRQLGETEKELLRFDRAAAGSWRDSKGNQWTAFFLEWKEDRRLNQNDITHNPTVCLPAAGLELVSSAPNVQVTVGDATLDFRAWEFRQGQMPLYAFVASRSNREYEQVEYRRGKLQMRFGNLMKVLVGNRSNPLQTLQLIVVGPRSQAEADRALVEQVRALEKER